MNDPKFEPREPEPTDPRAFGSAWADVFASMPAGAEFDALNLYLDEDPDDASLPYWEAEVRLASQDRCQHVDGCGHSDYRPRVSGTGKTADAALRALAGKLRLENPS